MVLVLVFVVVHFFFSHVEIFFERRLLMVLWCRCGCMRWLVLWCWCGCMFWRMSWLVLFDWVKFIVIKIQLVIPIFMLGCRCGCMRWLVLWCRCGCMFWWMSWLVLVD
ncbi:hypothetical protein MIMGU_mgv1a016775mg [Erythranthe guttata]|uniref:Uncharacterized protein n=1 Tax=Erythranthe guttata TaxID=4155 RepID=A0A022PVS0_ERYGU|nr:hypothetical protein MIMGU_mgv1a016775mg [Erythranthe guttata]